MIKRNTFLFTAFFLLFAFRCAATSHIGFGAFTLSANVLNPGDTLTINTSLKNYGPDAFNGQVGLSFSINGTQNINRSIFDSPIRGQTIFIPADDSFSVIFKVVVQPQYMVPGTDIFVVWPIIQNGNFVHDSLPVPFVVDTYNGIEETDGIASLKLQYIKQSIAIHYNGSTEPLQLRIFDLNGREINTLYTESDCNIPFYNQPKGIYFVEVNAGNRTRKVFKIVKLD